MAINEKLNGSLPFYTFLDMHKRRKKKKKCCFFDAAQLIKDLQNSLKRINGRVK